MPVPPESGDWRRGYIVMLLGGPIANLCLGGCLVVAALMESENLFWSHYLSVLAGISFFDFAINLLPLTKGHYKFDGARIAMALRGQDLEPWARMTRLSSEIVTPKRPRDWDARYVDAVLQDYVSGRGEGGIGLALCQYYLDLDDLDKARAALAWAAERLGEVDSIKVVRAIILAYFDKDAEGAAALLATIKQRALKKQPPYLTAQAIIARQTAGVKYFSAAIDRAKAAVKRAPFSTAAGLEFLESLADRPCHEVGNCLVAVTS